MKKLLSLVTVLLMLFTVSAMADSDSYVSGSINQGSSAIVQPSFSHPDMFGNAAASGSQNGGGSFFAHPASPSGEEASGSVTSNGSVTVQADVIHNGNQSIISTASGIAGNAGEVHILEAGGLTPTATNNLYGYGSMQTGTFASMGAGPNGTGNITNGGWAGAATFGSFGYNASGGPGWIGSGYTAGSSMSTVTVIPNGYTASSSASSVSVSCPK